MRSLVVLDSNTIWHRRLAESLAAKIPVVTINPFSGRPPPAPSGSQNHRAVNVSLPRGWASATAPIGQRLLARHVQKIARSFDDQVVLLLTSPAYAPLAHFLAQYFPIVSYTADDYRSYAGWGGGSLSESERKIAERAQLSVFVSAALRDRAVAEFSLDPARTLLSPNATEPRFSYANDIPVPNLLAGRPRPILGVMGGLSDRIDLQLVEQAASAKTIGTLLIVGPVSHQILARHPALSSDKVVITGTVPHESIHEFCLAMDAALIPYADTRLNYYCSPMRLYDHLATGVPIFATTACDQINSLSFPQMFTASSPALFERISEGVGINPMRVRAHRSIFWEARADVILDALSTVVI